MREVEGLNRAAGRNTGSHTPRLPADSCTCQRPHRISRVPRQRARSEDRGARHASALPDGDDSDHPPYPRIGFADRSGQFHHFIVPSLPPSNARGTDCLGALLRMLQYSSVLLSHCRCGTLYSLCDADGFPSTQPKRNATPLRRHCSVTPSTCTTTRDLQVR